MGNLRRRLAILGMFLLAAAPLKAAPLFAALGASDAVGLGSSTFSEAKPSQRNNGYVYLLHDSLRDRYPPWKLANLGLSGATVTSIVNGPLKDALALQPDLVTVWVGGNDVKNSAFEGEKTETLKARFEAQYTILIRSLRSQTGAFIVACNLPDMSRLPAAFFLSSDLRMLGKADSIALNEVIAKVCAAYGVPVVDLYSDPETYSWLNYSFDGFHPNDAGYEKIAAKFRTVIRRDAWRLVSGLGDVDGDGAVNAADAAWTLEGIGGMRSLGDRASMAADVSPVEGDGTAGIEDAVRLLRRAHGLVPDALWR